MPRSAAAMRSTSCLSWGVGEDLPLAAFVGIDEGCVSAPAAIDMVVDTVVGEVGLCAAEPLEDGRLPVEDFIPLAEPWQAFGGALPEGNGVFGGFALPAACDGVDCLHGLTCLPTLIENRTIDQKLSGLVSSRRMTICRADA